MKLRVILPVLVVIGLAVASAPALAQDPTLVRAQVELQRTDERIQQAVMLLSRSSNASQPQAEIEIARQRQEQARSELAAGHVRIAVALTLDARSHADRAIVLLRGADPARVQEQIDRARDFIDRARDRVNECTNDRARAQLHVGESMLDRSQDALNSGRPLAALQLARGARERALRALQLCRMEDNAQDSAEHALQRTDEILLRARDVVASHPEAQAQRALARADELQQAAWRQYRIEHVEAALRLTELARTFAQRALRLAGSAL